MARDQQRQLEAAKRIRDLRDPRPQHVVADALGVKLRTYQHWEEGDGISWENLEALAAYHGVSEDYILYGIDNADSFIQTQLDRIEAKLDVLVSHLPGPAKRHEQLIAEALQQARERNGATPQTGHKPRQIGAGS